MADNTVQIAASDTTRTRTNAFFRGFIEGAAGLFNIFCIGAGQRRHGTPEDDARELLGDVEQIAQDFHAVLSGIEATSKK
jgi:hypothetical protein